MSYRIPQTGDLIADRYRVERLLGRGAMGAVLLCHHELMHHRVAIKMLTVEAQQSKEANTRFLREAQAIARIQSDRIVRIHDVATLSDGTPYIVMEYLEGVDLAVHVANRGPLPIAEAIDIAIELVEGIAWAHEAGVVHRDLKPANVFLQNRASGPATVKVLDFGISKIVQPGAAQELTSTQAGMGSPLYMSPEQVRKPKDAGPAADIWAIGTILVELLTGKPPNHHVDSLSAAYIAILEGPPPPVRAVRPDVPPELEAVIHRCLEKEPARRFPRAVDLVRALGPWASSRGTATVARLVEQLDPNGGAVAAPPPRPSDPMGGTGPHLALPNGVQGVTFPLGATRVAPMLDGTNPAWQTSSEGGNAVGPFRLSQTWVVALSVGLGTLALIGVILLVLSLSGRDSKTNLAGPTPATSDSAAPSSSSTAGSTLPPTPLPLPEPSAAVSAAASTAPSARPTSTAPTSTAVPPHPSPSPSPKPATQPTAKKTYDPLQSDQRK